MRSKIRSFISSFLKLSRKKKIAIVVIFIVFITIIFTLMQGSSKKNGYVFEKAKITSLTEVVSESGTISSDGNIPIYSPTNGSISEIYVENGQTVKSGQELFKVISSATDAEKQAAYSTYLAAKADFDADNATLYSLQSTMYSNWKSFKDIATNSTYESSDGTPRNENRTHPDFTTVQDDWLAAEANYKNQQGVIAKDQAAVSSSYANYLATQTTVVKSPLDGIVNNISYSTGNSVAAKTALSLSARSVLIIKNSDNLEAVVPVGQTNIAKINVGQKAKIKPDAYKDKNYEGTVVRVDNMGENIQGVVTYNIYIKLEGDEFIKPGMTFDADIITQKLENVLTVPNSAVVLDKGVKTVRVIDNGKLKNIAIKAGVKGETRTQILSGVSEGQEIIVSLTNEKAQKPSLLGL